MIFRQFFDHESSTYTYLLADEAARMAVLIDPVREQAERDLEIMSQLGSDPRSTCSTPMSTPTT